MPPASAERARFDRHGGILQYVLRQLAQTPGPASASKKAVAA
jgi:hypothetical protein